MDVKPCIDIIIPCHNVDRAIDRCLQSLSAQTYLKKKYHCYFIDDASIDETPNILESYSGRSNITVLTQVRNNGLAAARNTGIKNSQSEMVCFLDGDMEVKPDWLESLLSYFDSNKVIAVMGDNVMPSINSPNTFEKYYFSKMRGARQFNDGDVIPARYMLFGNAMVKRDVLNQIGFFDESFLYYGGEDTDLSFRIWDVYPDGFRLSKKSESIHYHPRTLDSFCSSMKQYGRKNLPKLLSRYPQYKNDLAGDWIFSLKGYLFFNPIIRFTINLIKKMIENYWLMRYSVVDSVIRGARESVKEDYDK